MEVLDELPHVATPTPFYIPVWCTQWGPAPEIDDHSGCFPEGPDPPIPLLSISEWIKSRGPSLAFVNQTFLLSKRIKGQAPQNILGML